MHYPYHTYQYFVCSDLIWVKLADLGDNKTLYFYPFNVNVMTFGNSVDYNNSKIREWLNGDFYEENFTTDEKAKIVESSHENPGFSSSVDKIFLLSSNEYSTYRDYLKSIDFHYNTLDYDNCTHFIGCSNSSASSGSPSFYHLSLDFAFRDRYQTSTDYVSAYNGNSFDYWSYKYLLGVRPAVIIDTSK